MVLSSPCLAMLGPRCRGVGGGGVACRWGDPPSSLLGLAETQFTVSELSPCPCSGAHGVSHDLGCRSESKDAELGRGLLGQETRGGQAGTRLRLTAHASGWAGPCSLRLCVHLCVCECECVCPGGCDGVSLCPECVWSELCEYTAGRAAA